ncbi:PREDICTED: inactive disease susceptibility protein LOV1-like [Lupinus angustifolius]|uniref:inactive disease susceptibility protein LOV1-like n=1 Tax=Lupinus angustifolius TaxID=3871 RepID=UPI00092F6464|nr:PREDICTED: inactive disease susceptibility protein LOV1-like [Lupinus angustifolius]
MDFISLVLFVLMEVAIAVYFLAFLPMARLMAEAERRVEDVRRELVHMRAFLKEIETQRQAEVEGLDEWLDDLNDVARNAEDLLETFFDKTVQRSWIFSFVDIFKIHLELYRISKKMRKLSERRMKYDRSHKSANDESQQETSDNARVVPAVEKLSYILKENLVAGSEMKKMVEEVRDEVVSMVNVVFNLKSKEISSEREKVWLEEANKVCNFAASVIEDFITRRARTWFCKDKLMCFLALPGSSKKKLRKEMNYIKTQVRGALFRRLTYGVGEEDVGDKTGFSYGDWKRDVWEIIALQVAAGYLFVMQDPVVVILCAVISNFAIQAKENVYKMMSVNKRLESIKRDLALTHAFFKDIRGVEGLNKRQEVWVEQIREAAQQAQAILDECELKMSRYNGLYQHIFPPLVFDNGINEILCKIHNNWERKIIFDIANIEGSVQGSCSEIQIVVEHNDNSDTEEDPLLPAGMANNDQLVKMSIEKEVETIREDLRMMKALFHDAEEMGELDGRSNIWMEQMRENTREMECRNDEYASKFEDKPISIFNFHALHKIESKINETRRNILELSRIRKRYGIHLQSRAESSYMVHRLLERTQPLTIKEYDTIASNTPPYLMRCLSYFVLFPPDFEIPARRLIVLWVAQGLVRYEWAPPEQVAESYLKELIDLSMVQIAKAKHNGKVKTCRLPNALRQSTSFQHYLSIYSTNSDLMADHQDENDNCYNDIHSDTVTASASLKRLYKNVRSFLSFDARNGSKPGQDIGQFLNRCISSGCFLLLRVLDLERVYKPQLPKNIARLSRLRYLGLRWTYLESLPSSISSLLALQTLDLKHTYINILTSSIWKMQLRHLFLSETYRTRFPPHPIGNYLFDLQTLWGLFVDVKTPVKGGLDRLINIRKLRLACQSMSLNEMDMESQLKAVAKWIMNLKHLETLILKSRKEDGQPWDLHLESLADHAHLTDMYLMGILKSSSIESLFPPSLIELTLSHSELKQESVEILGHLPKLQSLCLFAGSYIEETLHCKNGNFPQLDILKIWKLEQLTKWNIEEEAFPLLTKLEIRSCNFLHVLPDGLQHVNTLTELKLTTMSENFMKRARSVDKHKFPSSCNVFHCYIKNG